MRRHGFGTNSPVSSRALRGLKIPYRPICGPTGQTALRYDDTLETVLAADVSTSFGKASAWRQLVDLIGRRRVAADARAFNLLRGIRDAVPVAVRAASARALEHANPPAPLVALCALDEISVAAPVLRSARMTSGEWVELLPRLSAAGRSVLRSRRDLPPGIDRALDTFGPIDFVVAGTAPEAAPLVSAGSTAEGVAPVAASVEAVAEPEKPAEIGVETPLLVEDATVMRDATQADPIDADVAAMAEGKTPPVDHDTPSPAGGAHEPALVQLAVTGPDEMVEAVAVGEPESVLAAVTKVESRMRMRLDSVLDPAVPTAPDPVAEPIEAVEVAAAPMEVAANISPFVSVGSAAMAIPVVARALGSGVSEGDAIVAEIETEAERSVESTLAPDSVDDQGAGMDDPFILGSSGDDRDAAPAEPAGPFEIADVVARIDAFYTLQQERAAHAPPPVRADGFRFETDEHGVIRWVDGVSRAPLIGLSLELNGSNQESRADGVAAGALRQRAAFSDARLIVVGESDAAGAWRISGAPAFDRTTGRFSGYRGTARRPRREENPVASPAPLANPAADSLRQLMHELRTPTNAIAGFAEMIEREMLGDAPPVYRERAGAIRTHARALLAAIDDLDIAARIEASALKLASGDVTLRPTLARIADDLGALAETRGAWIALPVVDSAVRGDARAIERMLARLLTTLLSAAGDGERVGVRIEEAEATVVVAMNLPAALQCSDGETLFELDDEQADTALLGTGFALRLVRNIARELGGTLTITTESVMVALPAAVTKSLEQAR